MRPCVFAWRLPWKKAWAPQGHGKKRAAAIKAASKNIGSHFPSDFKHDKLTRGSKKEDVFLFLFLFVWLCWNYMLVSRMQPRSHQLRFSALNSALCSHPFSLKFSQTRATWSGNKQVLDGRWKKNPSRLSPEYFSWPLTHAFVISRFCSLCLW